MGLTIAVAGKGRVGKTTLCALMIRSLRERGLAPILAVDADPNANLGEALGLTADLSIGRLQSETLKQIHSLPAGVPFRGTGTRGTETQKQRPSGGRCLKPHSAH